MALSWTMDKVGPMARSAEDCGLILDAIAGPDPRDPSTTARPFAFDPDAPARGLRLGILAHDYEAKHAPEARDRFTAALDVFRGLGHQIGEADLPPYPYDAAAGLIIAVEGASAFDDLIRSDMLAALADPSQQASLRAALAIPGVDYLRAMRLRAAARPVAVAVFERFDALIAPTLLQVAPPIDVDIDEGWRDVGGNGGFGNLLGWPSISIPMGTGRDGLPLGLEIVGAPYQEQTVLALAMAFQSATDWHLQRPPA
jgi:aspartyl-tRNA(Asn)/glutamyl-tRNA(Gln) amidotransferase subunit A